MKYAEPRLSAALTGLALQRLVKGLRSVPPNLFVESAPNRHKLFVVETIAGPGMRSLGGWPQERDEVGREARQVSKQTFQVSGDFPAQPCQGATLLGTSVTMPPPLKGCAS